MKLKFTYLTIAITLFAVSAMAQTTKTEGSTQSYLNRFEKSTKFSSNAKAIEGSISAANGYEAGTTLDIPFVLDLTNFDEEYADSISITFPTGFTINDVSNNVVFFENNDADISDEAYNGVDGQTITWGDNDDDFGGVLTPGSYSFIVNVTVDDGISGDQTGSYFISGDGYGPDPSDLSGNFTISEGVLVSVFDIIANSDDHTTLETALIQSELNFALSNFEAELTVFAPTDDAFAAIQSIVDELLMDPTGALANVLLYHVVGETLLSADFSDDLEIATVQGETVLVEIDGSTITVNGAEVTIANIEADNGVVHVINAVLIPTFCTVPNSFYVNYLNNDGEGAPISVDGICPVTYSPFASWASEAYQVENFITGTTYTFGLAGGDESIWDPEFFVQNSTTGEIVASETEGMSLTFEVPEDGTYLLFVHEEGFCGAQSENLETNNGIPFLTCESSLTITDIIVNSDNHNTLESAVIAADLDDTLAGDGPFTVFAPTDNAFDALPAGLLDNLLADPSGDLTTVLTHHVANGVFYSASLSDGQILPTLLGEDVTVGIDDNDVITITSSTGVVAEVTIADIVASNGVVHVIDAVLVPTVVNVKNLLSVDRLRVFPNPASNQFTLEIELNKAESVSFDLINVVGKVVKSVDFGNRSTGLSREYININDLSEGIYFMNLTVGANQGTVKVQVIK